MDSGSLRRTRQARSEQTHMSTPNHDEVYLSIVLSCYNESHAIEGSLSKLISFLNDLRLNYEIIVVDDFSKDNSFGIVQNIQTYHDNVRIIRNDKNTGKGFSIKRGILSSQGKYIIFTDMDMIYSLENLKTVLMELEKGNDIIVGNRRLPDSMYTVPNQLIKYVYRRHFIGVVFNIIVRNLFGLDTRDTQSGLKGFSHKTACDIFSYINTNRFVFDIEIFIRAKYLKKKIKEIPVHLTYFSQISNVKLLKYSFKAFGEVLTIKFYQMCGKYSR
jgi:dolichyl-phosphate beta-glucosyltransferase